MGDQRGADRHQESGARAPGVSVIVPVGAPSPFLADQLASLAAQETDFPYEVVVSCNATDESDCAQISAVTRHYADAGLRLVDAHDRRSASYARNVGAHAANGDVLAFCDADDLVDRRWLAALTASVADDVAVGGHLDEQMFAIPRQTGWRPPVTPGALPTFLGAPYAVSANFAVKRRPFEEVGGFDENLTRCEDIALSWRLRHTGVALRYAPDAVVHYRHRAGVVALVKQHYRYGIGMAQVLRRYGVPHDHGVERLSGVAALRPNGQPVDRRTFVGSFVRRASLAAGRVVGIATERTAAPAEVSR
jgi:cellulose synthase/poly-beta-1,6-N-acetylglucosamine synthase-like glycosyltransferase